MLGIALRFGISLEALLAANPDVNPTIISVGTRVIIPYVERTPAVTPYPTPIPVFLDDPACYPTALGGLWCFVLAQNDLEITLENVLVTISLYTRDGQLLAEGMATSPLDLIEAGKSLPLVYFFSEDVPQDYVVQVELISALPAAQVAERYLNPFISMGEVTIASDGQKAALKGVLGLPKTSKPARHISILAVAYDRSGRVVGIRERELNTPFAQGSSRQINVVVYSMGPEIERVEVFAEARP